MVFSKYSSIYRNDKLIINDESVQGIAKDVKEYLKYQLADKCMSMKNDYEDLVYCGRLILDLLEELENNGVNDTTIIVKFNPMGSLYYEEVE